MQKYDSLGSRKSNPRPLPLLVAVSLLALGGLGGLWADGLKIETIDVAPFGFAGPDGNPAGISYEIANLIAQESGLPYTNTIIPYAKTVSDLETGAASFVIRFISPEIAKNSIQVASIVSMPTIIVGLSGNPIKSLADLHGKTVGVLRGGSFDDRFASDALIQKYEVNNYNTMMKMLTAKHIDAALGSSIGLYYEAKNLNVSKAQLGDPFILNRQSIILNFSRKAADSGAIATLKSVAEKLKGQDKFIAIVNKYMGDFDWSLAK